MGMNFQPQVLRIGILGAARIAPNAICIPALALGHKLVAVGASDLARAKEFARKWDVEKSYGSYEEVINDPDINVIYNPLPNSHHAFWNIAALKAGKNVLSEKPFASNFEEAQLVEATARISRQLIIEGFHYLHSPVTKRAFAIVKSGEIGEVQTVTSVLTLPAPDASDIRWKYELAGGAMMDLGCYTVHIQRHFGQAIFDREPILQSASGTEHTLGVDQAITANFLYSNGATGRAICDMNSDSFNNTFTVVGSKGSIQIVSFVLPGVDDRVIVTVEGHARTEFLGRVSSYTWQLQAFADAMLGVAKPSTGIDDAMINAKLIDDIYRAAKMGPRPAPLTAR